MIKRVIFIFLTIFMVFLLISGGQPGPLSAKEIYKVAIPPEYLPIAIWERFHPLMVYLENDLGVQLELIIPRNFAHHNELVKRGEVAFSYQNPYVVLKVWEYCSPLTLTEKGKEWGIESRGVIIARKDRGIDTIEDLKGKKISIVSPYSAGGFVAQKVLLRGRLDVNADLTIYETKGNIEENVIFDVIHKVADAGFIAEEALGRIESKGLLSPGQMRDIKVVAYTDWIPNWIFCVDKRLPAELKKRVREALLNIPLDHPALKIAEIRRFVPIPSNYLEEYKAKIHGE